MTDQVRADPSRRAWPLFVIAVLIGLGTLVLFVDQAYRDVRITWFYQPATCTIIDSRVVESTGWYKRSFKRSTFYPEFTYQLQVGSRWFTAIGFDNMKGTMAHPGETSNYKRGQSYPCWYDPWNPEQAVLKKQVYRPYYFFLAFPLLFLAVGGNMLVLALRPVAPVKLDGLRAGEALAVRLHPEVTGRQVAGCLVVAAILLTGGTATLVAWLIRSERFNNGDGLTALAMMLAAIDVFVIYQLVQFIRGIGIPEPIVEIDHEPLHPGEKARVFVRQSGPARFAAFVVSVLCEEQGPKGTRTSHRHQLVSRKNVVITPGGDVTESTTMEIPADAQTSLKELQTIIAWKIVVQRKAKFKNADRDFVFRVLSVRDP